MGLNTDNSKHGGIHASSRFALLLSMIKGDFDAFANFLSSSPERPAAQLICDEAGLSLFALLNNKIQALLLAAELSDANELLCDCTKIYNFSLSHLDHGLSQYPGLMELLGLQALWRGDRHLLSQWFPDQQLPLTVAWWFALLEGRKDTAVQLFDAFVKQWRATSRKRKLELPSMPNMMAILTLLGSGDVAHYPVMHSLINHGLNYQLSPAYVLLERLLSELEGKGQANRSPPEPFNIDLVGMKGMLLVLAQHWVGGAEDNPLWRSKLANFRGKLGEFGYHALQYELNAVLQAQYNVVPPADAWQPPPSGKPLLTLYQRQEAWQYALSALVQLKPVVGTPSVARLAWFITLTRGHVTLEPKEQKRADKGQWSKGKAVALKRLYESSGEFDYLLGQDKQVLRHIHYARDHYYYGGSTYELDGDAALSALAGHPALFWSDAPDVRIDLTQGQVALHLKATGGQIELKLTPSKVNAESSLIVEKETPTRLVVYPINDGSVTIQGKYAILFSLV